MRIGFVVFLCLLAASLAAATETPEFKAMVRAPEVGSWARYRLEVGNSGEMKEFLMSVVQAERIAGKRFLWYETTVVDGRDTVTIKVLLPADPVADHTPQRFILKHAGAQAVEIPAALVGQAQLPGGEEGLLSFDPATILSELGEAANSETPLKSVQEEKLKVGGRELLTHRFRYGSDEGQTLDVWLCEQVPFYSLVRLVAPETKLELLEWSTRGAVSRINETPKYLGLKSQKNN